MEIGNYYWMRETDFKTEWIIKYVGSVKDAICGPCLNITHQRFYEAKERILGHVIFSGGAYSMKGMTLAFEDSTFTDYINQVNDFRQIINNYKIY